jgi:ADP-ribose pyrophosphatase YjhB (NUDIX family)
MYKVFVNDCPIILTDTENISTIFGIKNFDSIDVLDVVEGIFQNKLKGIYLFCRNLDQCFKNFQSNFEIQLAAGGKILNSNNETLFIYRFDKWDLPKGKLEQGESFEECAVREAGEECGISDLNIKKELATTYHIFKKNQKIILKITHWFLMHTKYSGDLTPQVEEGIERVLFKNKSETSTALQNTYENIKLLF